MYEQKSLGYRAIGYGFGVKRSDIYGVRGELKKRGLNSTNDHVEMQNMKIELASVEKQLRTLTSRLIPIYDVVCSGQASNEIIEEGRAVLTAAANLARDKSRPSDDEPTNFPASPSTPSSPI